MRSLILWLIALSLLFFVENYSRADDYSFKMGAGLIDGTPTGQVKTFSLRQERRLNDYLHSGLEAGFWTDTGRANERRGSGFGVAQVGVKPGAEVGLYGSAFLGVAGLTNTDSQLGGHFQFIESIGFGIRDRSSFIQFEYRHISSAGIYRPNKGRDFIVFSVGVSL